MIAQESSGQDTLPVDWFPSRAEGSFKEGERETNANTAMRQFLWPIGEKYFCELPAMFLGECNRLESLAAQEAWLSRDGLVPLLWFFHRFPDPLGLRCRIFIQEQFIPHVPEKWRPRIGSYRFGRLPGRRTKAPGPKRLLLTGILTRSYCSIPTARKLIRAAKAEMRAAGAKGDFDVFLCLFQKSDPLPHGQDLACHAAQLFVELVQEFGKRLKLMTLSEFHEKLDFSGFAVLDLNDQLLCADSWMVHQVIQRGGVLLAPPLPADHARYLEQDLRFGFGLEIVPRFRAGQANAEEAREQALSSPANYAFPWKAWGLPLSVFASRPSELLGRPLTLIGMTETFRLHASGVLGNIDSARLDGNRVCISGWCFDSQARAPFQRILLISGTSSLPMELVRESRDDIEQATRVPMAKAPEAGFTASVTLECLPRFATQDSLVWICAILPSNRAQLLGCVRVWQGKALRVAIVPTPEPKAGGKAVIAGEMLSIELRDQKSDSVRTVNYVYHKLSTAPWNGLWGSLDEIEVKGSFVRVAGWAADTKGLRTPEAVLLVYKGRSLCIAPASIARPDVVEMFDGRLGSPGFQLTAHSDEPIDSGKLRLFALWEEGIAIELPLASKFA